MHDALYRQPDGFFRRERPADHFRTSVHASGQFAQALVQLAFDAGVTQVVDVGAGSGEMLRQISSLTDRVDLAGVEIASRPAELPARIAWHNELPSSLEGALVVANEWLDNIPVDVAELDEEGQLHLVHVNPETGEETTGEPVSPLDCAWLDRWWPIAGEPGQRVEIGRMRDAAWADVTRRAVNSVCIAVDYCHARDDRPTYGTLSAYQHGRDVALVPDGSRDISAHVALDAVAAAGEAAGATSSVLTTQRIMLRTLGVTAQLPPRSLATTDHAAYVAGLQRASEAAELLAKFGLGGFGWLVQSFGRELPDCVTEPRSDFDVLTGKCPW
jgi:SAM-dependent MidA family methyltransferase